MPKFSIYTPTHDSRWLGECFRSLLAQTFGDWEWVILRNGDRCQQDAVVPPEIAGHPQVVVRESSLKGIGALKGEAVKHCKGDFFVELDHDDRLSADCLEEILKAASVNPGGFYYSDFTSLYPNGAPETFGSDWGWEKYEAEIDGQTHLCQRSFPPTPKGLSEIWFAPNHVRVWSREAYDLAKGYDPTLTVGDDHDLICRTFLTGVPFIHIQKPLYFYRRVIDTKTANSYVKAGSEVTRINYRNMNLFLHPMIFEHCRREKLPMLDLGGAHASPEGFIPVDMDFPTSQDWELCHSRLLNAPADLWPQKIGGEVISVLEQLPPHSVGCIRAFDFIEHLPRDRMITFMNEVYRVLVPDGFLISGTPSTDGRGAFQDPTHTNFINENSFWYYTDRDKAKYLNGKVTCRFQAVRLWTECPSPWHTQNNIPYVFADLLAIKGFKHIGPIHI
jgi:O-antigen biosynthesis protein